MLQRSSWEKIEIPPLPGPLLQTSRGGEGEELSLYFEQHSGRILDGLFDATEAGDRLASINEAVIVGERYVHHRPNHHVSIASHGPFLNGVQAEDTALRRIDDGGGKQRAINPAVADGEGAALK